MADLPEDVVDPGLVNVEDQAYPYPPPAFQSRPFNDMELIPGWLYAPPIVPPGFSNAPIPLNMSVESQVQVPPILQLATSAPFREEIDVAAQSFAGFDLREYIITDSGSFQTNAPGLPEFVDLTIAEIRDAQTLGAVGGGTTKYRITLSASLVPYGVPIQGREILVVAAATPGNVDQIRTVNFWNNTYIYIDREEFGENFVTNLTAGDTLRFDVDREGFEVINDVYITDVNIFTSGFVNPPADPVNASFGVFLGTAFASDGVAVPFVGSGTAAPPFLGTVQVAAQTFGTGLPANVFV